MIRACEAKEQILGRCPEHLNKVAKRSKGTRVAEKKDGRAFEHRGTRASERREQAARKGIGAFVKKEQTARNGLEHLKKGACRPKGIRAFGQQANRSKVFGAFENNGKAARKGLELLRENEPT